MAATAPSTAAAKPEQLQEQIMADEPDGPHIYGGPDPQNRQPPPPNGTRGEQGAPLADPPADQTRRATVAGRAIDIQETSGVAAAETTGKIGAEGQQEKGEDGPGGG
jgi:hypothetical protein